MRRSGHPRVTFLTGKVTKAILPRKAGRLRRSLAFSVGLRRCAYGSRRLPWRSFLGDGGMAPKATLFIPATCAHCRKRVRLGHWALHPCAGCARTESILCPFGLDFGLSSTLARLRGGSVKLPWFCCWAPYGAPTRRKPLAESPKGRARDRARGPPAQGRAVGTPPRQRRVRAGDFVPSGSLFFW